MNKKAISLFLALVMIVGLAVPGTLADESNLYDRLINTTAVISFYDYMLQASDEEKAAMTTQEITGAYNHLNKNFVIPEQENGTLNMRNWCNTQLLALPNAPALCSECNTLGGHTGGCVAMPTPTPEATPEAGEPTPTPEAGESTPVPEVTPEITEPTPEPVPTVFEQIMAGATTTDMLITMNGLVETDLDAVFALTFEEIDSIARRAKELDPELSSQDTVDLLDTLTYLPNSMANIGCPDCGQMVEHAEDCPRVLGRTLADETWNAKTWTTTSKKIDGTITIKGKQVIPNGVKLTIYTDNSMAQTIKRDAGYTGVMFEVQAGGTLEINGDGMQTDANSNKDWSNNVVIIDGGSFDANTAIVCSGKLILRDAAIKNNYAGSNSGGAIRLSGNTATVDVEVTRTLIDNCKAANGSGIMMVSAVSGKLDVWQTTIRNCVATDSDEGGTIRTNGGGNIACKIRECVIDSNTSGRLGGGIYWNANGANAKLTVTNSVISNNKTTGTSAKGGGMFLEGSNMEISSTDIIGNSSETGGGICINSYSGGMGVGMASTDSFNLIIGSGVNITDNTATKNGGGVAMAIHSADPADGYSYNIKIEEGAVIENNTAGTSGGAIHVNLSGTGKQYNLNVDIAGGMIRNNTATNGDGGAIYLNRTYATSQKIFAVSMSGGTVTGNKAPNGKGGSIYVSGGNMTMSGGQITGLGDVVIAKDGGAFYLNGGNFTMNGGTITENTVSGDGGAINVGKGNITIYSGTLSNNSAGGTGGALTVSSGNVIIGLESCKGKDNTHSHPVMTGNHAGDNGGAIGIVGGTTTMYCGSLSGNSCDNNPTSNSFYQNGGQFDIYGGSLDLGIDNDNGGDYNDYREGVYSITFKAEYDGIVHASYTQELSGGEIILPGSSAFEGNLFDRPNMVLYGWSTEAGKLNDDYMVGQKIIFSGHATLYAIWVDATYPIEYNPDGGTIPSNALAEYRFSPTTSSETVPLAEKAGYTFLGWTVSGEGNWVSGECMTNLNTTGKYGKVTLTANWGTVDYYITYDFDGGYNPGNLPGFKSGQLPIDLKNPTKNGYTFTGWNDEIEGTTLQPNYTIASSESNYRDHKFKALWDRNEYKATLDYGGGIDNDNQTNSIVDFNIDDGFTLPDLNRPGYTFNGWIASPAETSGHNWDVNIRYEGTMDKPYGDVTLTAMWTQNMVTINYVVKDNFGGEVTLGSETIGAANGTPAGSKAEPLPGFKFVGWHKDGKLVSTSAEFKPDKVGGLNEAATYTAVFDYYLTGLTIGVTNSTDANQDFLFAVSGAVPGNASFSTTVAVKGNGSVTIDGLQIGQQYTITPLKVWSWRFGELNTAKTIPHTLLAPTADGVNTVTFDAGTRNPYWLSGDDNAVVN